MAGCTATLVFDSPRADALEGALAPEAAEPMLRARATLAREGERVTVRVEAEDVVALRAAVNGLLRAATAVEGALAVVE